MKRIAKKAIVNDSALSVNSEEDDANPFDTQETIEETKDNKAQNFKN